MLVFNSGKSPEALFYYTPITCTFHYLCLSLYLSKIDTFCAGVTFIVAATFDKAYTVTSIKSLFTQFLCPQSSPLFDLGSVISFTQQLVTETLRSWLKNFGYTVNYLGHSFCQRVATSVEEVRLTDKEIELFVSWKSDSYWLYINTSTAHILIALRQN